MESYMPEDKPTTEPVVVSADAGLFDSLQAAGRYVVVIVGFATAIAGFTKSHDLAGAANYVQANLGQTVAAAAGLVALGTAAYGVFKTHLRGAQIATVASDERVPDKVAQIKE
jgi:hypothetical protein